VNTYYLISGGILGLGFLISLFFILWGKRKQTKGIDSYKRIRDKLTVREPKPEKETSYSGGFSIGNLIGGFIVILVGFTLFPTISEQVGIACDDMSSNVSTVGENILCGDSAGNDMFGIVSLFFALAIAICLTLSGLRGSGLV